MDKNFQFQRGFLRNDFELFECDLPFEDDTPDSHLFRGPDGHGIVERHLRGSVDGQFGKILPDHPDDTDVLYDDGIGSQLSEKRQLICRIVDFGLPDESVERDVDFAADSVSAGDEF